jgi:hypothetical protein
LDGSEIRNSYPSPVLNTTDDHIKTFDLELNFSMLPEGMISFNVTLKDIHGRSSNSIIMDFEVDRTPPIVTWELEPYKDPMIYNDDFSLDVITDDDNIAMVICEVTDSSDTKHFYELSRVGPVAEGIEWTVTIPVRTSALPDGHLICLITAIDDLDQSSDSDLTVMVDTIPPEIIIQFPTEGEMWYTSTRYSVVIDVIDDQTVAPTISDAWVSLRCMENWTEVANVSLTWTTGSFMEGEVLVPHWANTLVPWRVEIYTKDLAGNMAGIYRMVEISDDAG